MNGSPRKDLYENIAYEINNKITLNQSKQNPQDISKEQPKTYKFVIFKKIA